MAIKKNVIVVIGPILLLVPSLFTLPFFLIYTVQSSPLAIVPTFIDLMLVLLGLLTLNQFIRFGSKLMVIGVDELTFCPWNIKRIPWIDIKDIQLKTTLSSDYIQIKTDSPRNTVISGLFFARHIEEGWKLAGMFVGTYTGGSSQLTAIGIGLGASSDTMVLANAADYAIGMPALIFFFAAPALMKGSKAFNRFWPQHMTEEQLLGDGSHEGLMDKKEWSIKDIGYMLAIAFMIVYLSTQLAGMLFPQSLQSPMRIILITTLTILAAQLPFVHRLKGNLDLGLLFSMIFLATIGFQVNLALFVGSALMTTLYCFTVIVGSTLLHFLITKLFRVKYEFVLLSIVAGVADGTTSAMVASGAQWKTLIQVGMIMGVLAGALGNYVGIGIAYLIKGLCGL